MVFRSLEEEIYFTTIGVEFAKRRGNVIYLTLENFLESDVGKRWTLGADQWGVGGGIFYETFYHKILLGGGGGVARIFGWGFGNPIGGIL